MLPQDSLLPDEAMELSSLRGSVADLRKLNGADSRGKEERPTSVNISSLLSADDGTASSSSFIILPPRELPRIPSVELLSPEETYSNLSFPKRAEEVLYESVTLKGEGGGGGEESSRTTQAVAVKGSEEQADGAQYARVLKWNKKKKKEKNNQAGPEAGPAPALQEPYLAGLALTPQKIEEMYSVVCKDKKMKKMDKTKAKVSKGLGEEGTPQVEMSRGNCQVAAASQESDGLAGHQPSLFPAPTIERCYESINSESWMGREERAEPAYETVDSHWTDARRKGKLNRNILAENLYETIENVTFPFQNHNVTSHFEN
ncbi:uncharacterized protein LOC134395083 [Elgaria multicarinata webbii]|uniref:uncharacterized protein LOC134395083 n=1 Tax=Elgaria multicarinata webbii TaxID=159646 RepID=UPI002FCD4024